MSKVKRDAFRRSVRIPATDNRNDPDYWVVKRLQQLEADSPYRLQDWMRGALRNELQRELDMTNKIVQELAALEHLAQGEQK